MDNLLKMKSFAAVQEDGEGVLGKILYYSLSSMMVDKLKLAELCADIGLPYDGGKRVALADAFRSATGDIHDSKTIKDAFGTHVYKIYCRDNKAPRDGISRELIKETLDSHTNQYKKLANISYSKDYGFGYDDLAYDEHVDPLEYCQQAGRLYELYQTCAGRKQIETLLESFVYSLQAVKLLSHGKMYFVPREHMHRLAVFEELITALEENNLNKHKNRLPMDANSMYVVDDEKQRQKMAAAFYRSVQREIVEYQERAEHLIQTGSQSPAILERWVMRIDALHEKKRKYEEILKQELNQMDEGFQSLGYLSQELQIRARGLRLTKAA